jgi:hypothetical protein
MVRNVTNINNMNYYTTVKYLKHFNTRGSTLWLKREERSTILLKMCSMSLPNNLIYL